MGFFLLYSIKLYWLTKSKSRAAKCIFRKSCSHYVYDITKKKGLLKGLQALKYRINNCKYGFEIYNDPESKKYKIILPNKDILEEEEIAERLLT